MTFHTAHYNDGVVAGATYQVTFNLYSDEAETVPFNLTGYTVAAVYEGLASLTSGAGLVVMPEAGSIEVTLSAAQTAAAGAQVRYYVSLTSGAGIVLIPVQGVLTVGSA